MSTYKNTGIKDWALEDRPREKLLAKGIASLSNAELLAILIRSGGPEASAVELARQVLKQSNNNLQELGRRGINDLVKHNGMGPVKAITIVAALELGRRRKKSELQEKIRISGSQDVFVLFQPVLGDLSHEEFWVLLVNRSNRVIDNIRISQGGISGTVIDVRLILKNALDRLASSLILCHNHPSGNLKPSDADIKITSKISEAGKTMDIQLLDHLIIADNSYFSFSDEGLI
ncbi:DNA repair protein RadC [Bacteroidota bacterium]